MEIIKFDSLFQVREFSSRPFIVVSTFPIAIKWQHQLMQSPTLREGPHHVRVEANVHIAIVHAAGLVTSGLKGGYTWISWGNDDFNGDVPTLCITSDLRSVYSK